MSGPNPSLPPQPALNQTNFDTNGGVTSGTVPGFESLGTLVYYLVPVAGYYRFHATVRYVGTAVSAQNLQMVVGLFSVHSDTSRGFSQESFSPQLIGQADAATTDGVLYSQDVDYTASCAVGDYVFVYAQDSNPPDGSSSYLSYETDSNSWFEGVYLGS